MSSAGPSGDTDLLRVVAGPSRLREWATGLRLVRDVSMRAVLRNTTAASTSAIEMVRA